jgi:hypothetical protein
MSRKPSGHHHHSRLPTRLIATTAIHCWHLMSAGPLPSRAAAHTPGVLVVGSCVLTTGQPHAWRGRARGGGCR